MDFETLIQQPESKRDEAWEEAFLAAIPKLNLKVDAEEPKEGPDGWPYLFVRTGAEGEEPFLRVIQWLATRGIGMVVNAHKMLPDYIFTYGMIWNFAQTSRFILPPGEQKPGQVTFEPGQKLITGAPSEAYLPSYVRGILREFLAQQGINEPKVLVISSEDFKSIDLVLSTDSLGGLPPSEHAKLAEAIAWFLPLHYSLVLAPEQNLPRFHAL